MEKPDTPSDGAALAVARYLSASELALESARKLRESWALHLEGSAPAPSPEWIAEVAAHQLASQLALDEAKTEVGPTVAPAVLPQARIDVDLPVQARTRRRRRRENKFLASIGRPGQRVLRWTLVLLMAACVLVATGAGISLALEMAGALHLIDDPVQLPVGIQLVLFLAGTGAAWGLRIALHHVDRALYGSKGLRPKGFPL